jgi:hypothetical protein
MHPKYWKFPGGRRFMDTANDADGQGQGAGGTGSTEQTEAEKAAAAAAAAGSGEGDDAGKPKPTDAEAKLIKEVMNKKTALQATQTELNEVKARLAAFDGLDAAELRSLLDEKKVLETRKLEEKGEWDRLKAQMAEENKKVVDGVTEQLTAANARAATLANQVAELTVGGAFNGSTYIREQLTLPATKARALYGSHFQYDAEKGAVVAFDKAAGAAERTVLVDSQGEPLSFELALKKLVDADPDRDQITRSTIKPGSGSKSTEKGAPPKPTFDEPKGINRIAAALRAANAAK